MRAIRGVVIAASAGALLSVGSIPQSHSQQAAPPSVDCGRPQNAEDAALCRDVLRHKKIQPPALSSDDLKGRAVNFVLELIRAGAKPDLGRLPSFGSLYADQVSYHGKLATRQSVLDDKVKFANRWPERKYQLNTQGLVATCDQSSSTCTVTGILDWQVRSSSRKASSSGKARFTYSLARQGLSFVVVSENSSVLTRIAEPKRETALAEPSAIVVEMSVAVTTTNPPVITGSTNLPDGTKLMVHLLGDPPACVPRCGIEYESATVQSGRFTTSLKGSLPLISGSYTIDIVMAGVQPKAVQSVIGKFGEHLRGPYVVTLEGGKYVAVRFPRSTAQLDDEKLFGLSIRYTQKIQVRADASSDAGARAQAVLDIRKWSVKSCTSNIDFVNALVRAGSVTGREILGAERQAKIDACIADSEATIQAALKPQQLNSQPAASETRVPANTEETVQTQSATCQAMRLRVQDWTPQEQEAYRRQGCWHRVEADNGAVYKIDLGLIQQFAGGATTAIYTDEGGAFNAMNLKRWYFTCTGHFSVMQDNMRMGPTTYAPPRSVAARMSDIVCGGAGAASRN